MSSIILQRPELGQPVVVLAHPDSNIRLDFATENVGISREGDNLVFSFEDGARIELSNFYVAYSSESMPDFIIEENIVPGEAFFAALDEDLMPAAGNNTALSGGSTVGFLNATLNQGITSLDGVDQVNNTSGIQRTAGVDSTANSATQNQQNTDANNVQATTAQNNVQTVATNNIQNTNGADTQNSATTNTQAPSIATSEVPSTTTSEALSTATPETPSTATPETPSTATPETPSTATPETPSTATPETPSTATPETPSTATPETPSTATPEIPSTAMPEVPSTSTPPPPQYSSAQDVLAADAGSRLEGNLLANDNVPSGTLITSIVVPENWDAVENTDGSFTLNYMDNITTFTIQADGTFELITNINNVGIDDFEFSYTATDPSGQDYSSIITIGNANVDNLSIDVLEGNSAVVTDIDSGTTYDQQFSSYLQDANIGNRHVNGVLLGAEDDELTIDTAIGTQENLYYAGKGDTFIYGDLLDNTSQDSVGSDTINIETLDGTKIRADGNLFNGVEGGDDTVNVTHMKYGSIMGDGWTLQSGSKGGDDVINVDTMNAGEIYGEGIVQSGAKQGGDDTITVNTIDTTMDGRQQVIIDGDTGNDTVNIGSISTTGSDKVVIDGGLGEDLFNYDNADNNTISLSGNNIYIKDVSSTTTIQNFEGIGSGSGDDLIKLYNSFDDIVVDGGEDMDILLANASSKSAIEDMINNGNITNTEYIVLNNSFNNASTSSTDDLLNKLEGEGVSNENNTIKFDDTWTKGESVGNFDQYNNADGDMTIFVAQTQLTNTIA